MNKRQNKAYRKLLSKRQLGTYQDVAQYVLDNEIAYQICFSETNKFFVLNDFENFYFKKLVKSRNNKNDNLDEIINKVMSFCDEDETDEASFILESARRKKKIEFYTRQLNKVNILKFPFDNIYELILKKENIIEFNMFCYEKNILNYDEIIQEFTELLISNLTNRIDFFLYDSLFYYLTEDFCYEKKYEIKKIEEDFETSIDSTQTPFKHKFGDYLNLGEFLKEFNGLYRNINDNTYYPQTYGEACFDDLEAFFHFVIKITLSKICHDRAINFDLIKKFKIFKSIEYKSVINDVVDSISKLDIKTIFTLFNSPESIKCYQKCLVIEHLETKCTDAVWQIIESIKEDGVEKDIILLNNNSFNISMKLHKNGKFGFLNDEKELFLTLFKSFKSFSKSTLIIKEKTNLKYNSNDEPYCKMQGYYFGEYRIAKISKKELFQLKGNKLIVEYKI